MEIINLGNIVLNNYLIRISDKNILIDTGYPRGFKNFYRKLRHKNIELSDIDYIVLTHAHDDHAGFLNEILNETNARLIVHKKSVERLSVGHNLWIGGCPNIPAKIFVLCMGLFGKSKHEYPKVVVPEGSIIWDNQNQPFEEENIPLRLIELPGHTDDSIGIIYKNEILFCGDAAMNNFPSINRIIIWIENPEDYKKSWDKMIAYKAKSIYPSHGKPFRSQDFEKYRKTLDKIKIR